MLERVDDQKSVQKGKKEPNCLIASIYVRYLIYIVIPTAFIVASALFLINDISFPKLLSDMCLHGKVQ